MKLFGHYIFEEDPELQEYHQAILSRKQGDIAVACERGESDPFTVRLPSIPFADHLGLSQKASEKEDLHIHREYTQRGECHYFNGKKYCYHTGREIVSDALC